MSKDYSRWFIPGNEYGVSDVLACGIWVPHEYVDVLGLEVVSKVVKECGKDLGKAIPILDRYVALKAFA